MKKLFKNVLMLGAMSSALFFTACDSEIENPLGEGNPTITVTTTPADAIVGVNETFSFTAQVNAPAGFNTIRIESFTEAAGGTIDLGGYVTEYTRNDLGLEAGATSATIDYTPLSLPVAGEFTISLLAVDENGGTGSFDITLTVEPASVNTYTAQLLFAPTADGTTSNWFSTNIGTTVTEDEVNASAAPSSSDIDFGYYYGSNDKASIASPNAYPTLNGAIDISDWNTRNATEFRKTTLNNEEYVAISNGSDVLAAWNRSDNINEGETITNLAAGTVVAFQLDTNNKGGKYGLFKVVSIVDANSNGVFYDNVDYMEIEVIIEQ